MIETLYGLRVQISPDQPRYTLPEEVLPGVPWPPSFRARINNWSTNFLGTWNLVDDKIACRFGNTVMVSPRLYKALRQEQEQLFKPRLSSHYVELG